MFSFKIKSKSTNKIYTKSFTGIILQRYNFFNFTKSLKRASSRLSISNNRFSEFVQYTQGMFVGSVADNIDEKIEQKIFHCQIMIDNEKVAREVKDYKPIPVITPFLDENGSDVMQQQIQRNYDRIKSEARQIIADEKIKIQNDPELKGLPDEAGGEGYNVFENIGLVKGK